MKKSAIFVWLLLLLTVGCALANGSSEVPLNTVIAALETPFRSNAPPALAIRDFEADFVQQAYLGALDRVEEGEGRVAVRFQREGERMVPRFRWEYISPTVQEIISDGQTVWVYLPENNQVLKSPLSPEGELEQEDPLAFLTGLGNLSQRFKIGWATPARNERGDYRLLLEPLRPSSLIEQLVLVVDSAAVTSLSDQGKKRPLYPLKAATIHGSGDSRTTILFRNVRINQGLAEERFRFQPPPGVEVLLPEQNGLGF